MIYLASPYSAPELETMQARFEAVRGVAAALLEAGKLVYSPIVHGHAIASAHKLPTDFDFWMRHCVAMLRCCESLYVLQLPGWRESRGVTAEIEWWGKHRDPRRVTYLDPRKSLRESSD